MNALYDVAAARVAALRMPLLAAIACLLFGMPGGCGQAPADRSPRVGKVDVLSGPRTKTVMYVIKEGNPVIFVDFSPELPNFQSCAPAGQEEYLLKRALLIASAGDVLKRKEYEGKDAFVVRIILVLKTDEYDRPSFGDAPEIALLHLARETAARLTPQRIAAMTLEESRKAFVSRQVTLTNIPQGTAK
jgi:hypothetical protein